MSGAPQTLASITWARGRKLSFRVKSGTVDFLLRKMLVSFKIPQTVFSSQK